MNKKGLMFAIFTGIISGISIFYNKQIVINGLDPLIFNLYKNFGAALAIFVLLTFQKQSVQIFKLPKTVFIKTLLIGIIGGSIPFVLYFEGLRSISAVSANIIHKSLFIWVSLLAFPLLKEKLKPGQLFGYLLILWSNFFWGVFPGLKLGKGELLVFAATLLWSLEYILAKKILKKIPANVLAFQRMFFGSVFLLLIIFMENKTGKIFTLSQNQLLPILGSVILLTGYVTFWLKSLKILPATLVSSVLIISTPITSILTMIFVNHNFNLFADINILISLVGILLIYYFRNKKRYLINQHG